MLIHSMKLMQEPFNKIKNQTKTIEVRLYDEKRQQVQVGDFIEFSLMDNAKVKLQVVVTNLYRFSSFDELYKNLSKEKLGYLPNEIIDANCMNIYYSTEKQSMYDAFAIEFRLTDLQKFIDAQNDGYGFGQTYKVALDELKHGRKVSHWIWYVFPQIDGLGWSSTTKYFSIKNLQEAIDYYNHPFLHARLIEITSELLNSKFDNFMYIFGYPDAYKVRSCMTLFNYAIPNNNLFRQVIDKFCQGLEDNDTIKILQSIH